MSFNAPDIVAALSDLVGGLAVERWTVQLGDRCISGYGLRDAADLLDEPSFAREFVEQDRAPYWAQLWPASLMLAEHVWACPDGSGQSAIELGCGLGLVSIAAALRGYVVTASDYDRRALDFVRANASLNGVRSLQTAVLDWAAPVIDRTFDWVLAADVLYERPNHAPLISLISRLLTPSGVAIIADPNRPAAGDFGTELTRAGFGVQTRATRTRQPGTAYVDGTLYIASRQA